MPARFTIRIMAWREALPLARPVREQVFIDEQKVPRELEWDEWDDASDHALAFDARGDPIGTARLLADGRIGRMAVLKDWRGKGVGAALLQAMLERARSRSMPRALLHAQIQAAGFYRRFGFSERGGEFLGRDSARRDDPRLSPRKGSADSDCCSRPVFAVAALVELHPAVVREAQHCGAPRSVSSGRENADRRQSLLELQAHPGAGKLGVGGALGVA